MNNEQFAIVACLIQFNTLTTKFPMTTVAKKNGIHDTSPTSMQSHIDSIHSPHSTRNTIMNECMKSVKFQRGISPSGNRNTRSSFSREKLPKLVKLNSSKIYLIGALMRKEEKKCVQKLKAHRGRRCGQIV